MDDSGNSRYSTIVKKMIRAEKWPRGSFSVPLAQAHRGYHKAGARENTIEAFQAARSKGYEMYELDVQLSKDRIPVVFHDQDISRFVPGDNTPVAELTAAELKGKVNAPSLREVLLANDIPQYVNIELKTRKKLDEALERKTFELLRELHAFDRVLVSSFNPLSLWRFSLYCKDVPMALIVGNDMDQIYLQELWLAPFIPIHLLHLDQHRLGTLDDLTDWKNRGVPVAVWTVNELQSAQDFLDQGALSIITDSCIPSTLSFSGA